MKRLLVFICSIFSMSLFGCKDSFEKENVINISPEDLFEKLQSDTIQLIDVRTPKEFKVGFIKTAKNINYFSSAFSSEIDVLDKEKPIYIYCRSGKRSEKSIKIFQESGFTQIYNLEGGLLNWKEKELQIINKKSLIHE